MREPETPVQSALSDLFNDAAERWNYQQDVSRYLRKMGGEVLCGHTAKVALEKGCEGHVVFMVVDEHPFIPEPDTVLIDRTDEDYHSPAAIKLPAEIAERIVILGGLP